MSYNLITTYLENSSSKKNAVYLGNGAIILIKKYSKVEIQEHGSISLEKYKKNLIRTLYILKNYLKNTSEAVNVFK